MSVCITDVPLNLQIILSQDPQDSETSSTAARSTTTARSTVFDSLEGLKLTSTTKLVGRRYAHPAYQREEETYLCSSDAPTKKGYLTMLTDASQNTWEKRWFVLRRSVSFGLLSCTTADHRETTRPYLHMYLHSNEIEEIGVISLEGVNIESDPQKELLLGVCYTVFRNASSLIFFFNLATFLLHSFHFCQLVCPCCPKPQGAAVMDIQVRSDSYTFITLRIVVLWAYINDACWFRYILHSRYSLEVDSSHAYAIYPIKYYHDLYLIITICEFVYEATCE